MIYKGLALLIGALWTANGLVALLFFKPFLAWAWELCSRPQRPKGMWVWLAAAWLLAAITAWALYAAYRPWAWLVAIFVLIGALKALLMAVSWKAAAWLGRQVLAVSPGVLRQLYMVVLAMGIGMLAMGLWVY